jgi:hypothetical protein
LDVARFPALRLHFDVGPTTQIENLENPLALWEKTLHPNVASDQLKGNEREMNGK